MRGPCRLCQRSGIGCRSSKRRFRRRGLGTVELLVSLVLFGLLLSSVGPMVRRVSVASRAGGDRWVANQELASLMDRIAALPSDQRNSRQVEALRNAAELDSGRETLRLTATVSDEVDGLVRVDVSATWKTGMAEAGKPVALTAWFRGPATQPEDAE